MTEVQRWVHLRDAAGEACVWQMIATVAEENKKVAREFVAKQLFEEDSRGVDAYANGQLIGSVTRSKPVEKRDVTDMGKFIQYVAAHRPDLLRIDYQAKDALLRTLTQVDGVFVDGDGVVVPGVGTRMTRGSVKVNPDKNARTIVRGLLRHGRVDVDGIRKETPRLEDA